LKCDGTRAETRFRLSTKRRSPFKSAGASVQSTTDSWGLRISGSNAEYTMFRGGVKSTGQPLHSPVSTSLPLPGVPTCHHISAGLYYWIDTFIIWSFTFRRTAVQNFVIGWYIIHTGDVTHEDSYDVCSVPGAATTLQATPSLNLIMQIGQFADPSGRTVWGVSLRPLTCWDCGIESRWGRDVCLLWALCVVR
jgi:hypothetical protein